MPTFKDLLSKTMLFTGSAPKDVYSTKLGKDDSIAVPQPAMNKALSKEDQPRWSFTHDPASPAKVTNLNCLLYMPKANGAADDSKPGMQMPVCTRVEVLNVNVTLGKGDKPISLPLTKDYGRWSNFFDYWNASPPTGVAFKMVDPARGARTVKGAIQRERDTSVMRRFGIYESSSEFPKVAGQGAYDNLHIAPRMKFKSKNPGGPAIPNATDPPIVMAPFCVHDCLHTHVRWGTLAGNLPMSDQGFKGRVPYQVSGAPLVPADQTVFMTLTKTGSTTGFEYKGIQNGKIQPATWSVIYHHGSAYAIEVTGTVLVPTVRFAVGRLVADFDEPYTSTDVLSDNGVVDVDDVDPGDSWAAFYQRLQFTGKSSDNKWLPRIKLLNLKACEDG